LENYWKIISGISKGISGIRHGISGYFVAKRLFSLRNCVIMVPKVVGKINLCFEKYLGNLGAAIQLRAAACVWLWFHCSSIYASIRSLYTTLNPYICTEKERITAQNSVFTAEYH
jgi:hypothetical protein